MTDRTTELRGLADELRERDVVDDAFLAKSFTDRLLIVDVARDGSIPDAVERHLATHDLRPAGAVYGDDDGDVRASVGNVGESKRHHFVDVRTRGAHRSYVVD